MDLNLRLNDADQMTLQLLAEMDGISQQAAIVRAIRETAERRDHERDVAAAAERTLGRYATVVERLTKE